MVRNINQDGELLIILIFMFPVGRCRQGNCMFSFPYCATKYVGPQGADVI